MKKKLFIAMAALFLTGGVAQAQANEQGNVIIDPYYGFPNLGKSLADQASEGLTGTKVTGYGPAGIRIEYMLGDQFGLGVDAIFNGFGVEGTATDTTGIDGMGNPITTTRSARATMNRYRIQARFNYHFDVSSPDLDVYMGIGAGTNLRVYKYYEDDVEQDDQTLSGSLIPFSMRFAAGMRYYFTDNIGLNAEIGLGGPIASAGLSFRF